jgi:hypothetical protein
VNTRRLSRIAVPALCALSLILCAGSLFMWIRSYWRCDSFMSSSEPELICLQSHRGAVHYVHVTADRLAHSDPVHPIGTWSSVATERARLWQEWNGPRTASYTTFGFAYVLSAGAYTIAAFPYWCLTLMTALAPAWWFSDYWRRPRTRRCKECGHKLRRAVDHCPKCGHVFAKPEAAPPVPHTPPIPRPAKKVSSVVIESHTHESDNGPTPPATF